MTVHTFKTKADTLISLQGVIDGAEVLPLVKIRVSDWPKGPEKILENVLSQNWGEGPLIVRSSAYAEDTSNASMAGHYHSVLNVNGQNELKEAIDNVISSFEQPHSEDHVFVQPMLLDVDISGVAFTRDPNTKGPYFVVNYASNGAPTDLVTGGGQGDSEIYIHHHYAEKQAPAPLEKVITACRSLMEHYNHAAIDLEFAITRDGTLYILQARPLAMQTGDPTADASHIECIKNIENMVSRGNHPHPYLVGKRTVYGVMPDWNPAEIIGIRPRPLALSLYRYLITDATWAYQRDNYGYRNLRSMPLMVNFHGIPYIDVRVSFNSLIPKDINEDLAERLVDYYIDNLVNNPELHDKIEFDVVFTCYTLNLSDRLQRLTENGFSASECNQITDSLRNLTNNIINNKSGLWKRDLEKIKELEKRREHILTSGMDRASMIYWLLEDCRRYGTLPFAGLARAGFIAIQLLDSLVDIGVLSLEEKQCFLSSLNTVGSRLVNDFTSLSQQTFLQRYGHLRPGTYDILSPRYDEMPELYFNWDSSNVDANPEKPPHNAKQLNPSEQFTLSLDQLNRIEKMLSEHGFDNDVLGFFEFLKAGIEGREYAKFVFTRSLSDAMSIFSALGEEYGISNDDCSYSNINCIKDLMVTSHDPKRFLMESIEAGHRQYDETKLITLPSLIVTPDDVWSFYENKSSPNFVTQKQITASVIHGDLKSQNINGAIVFIPSADPGFDWIFSHKIGGLITKYGGVNSHMAIRSNELGIPAVIGVGEARYSEWSKANTLSIDCTNKRVEFFK